jgi:hypothetical protein
MLTLLRHTVLLHELQTNYTNYSSAFKSTKEAIRVIRVFKFLYCLTNQIENPLGKIAPFFTTIIPSLMV